MSNSASTLPAALEASGSAAGQSSSMLARLTALLFVIAVIGAECLIASVWLSSGGAAPATETSSTAAEPAVDSAEKENKHGKEGKTKENKEKKDKKEKHGASDKESHGKPSHAKAGEPPSKTAVDPQDQIEVDLDEFQITTQSATSSTTMRVEFHLYGVIKASDKEDFERLMKACQHRLRDQILRIVRSARPQDLSDAGLGLIKRQILEKTNALLGKPLLREVIVSDFSYLEQ